MEKKKKKWYFAWGIGLFCLFLLGCAEKGLKWEEDRPERDPEAASQEKVTLTEEASSMEATPPMEEAVSTEAASDEAEREGKAASIWVHVSGEVVNPGVYELKEGSRLWEAVSAAGGVTQEGDENYLNQAQILSDGMKITIPSQSQVEEWGEKDTPSYLLEYSGDGNWQQQDAGVDLNTADKAALCTLPGIGESRAESILAYRDEHGPFKRIEDIMKVSGIKEAAFEKIKDRIRVSGN